MKTKVVATYIDGRIGVPKPSLKRRIARFRNCHTSRTLMHRYSKKISATALAASLFIGACSRGELPHVSELTPAAADPP